MVQLREALLLHERIVNDPSFLDSLKKATVKLSSVIKSGGKILIAGNGGSAADAQHFAAELVGKFLVERNPIPAIALTTNTSLLTALGNDYGFEKIFARQVEALGKPNDAFVAISTSGNSPNIIDALKKAASLEISTVGLLGRDGGSAADICDIPIIVPHEFTPRIQEIHILIIHSLCGYIESEVVCEL